MDPGKAADAAPQSTVDRSEHMQDKDLFFFHRRSESAAEHEGDFTSQTARAERGEPRGFCSPAASSHLLLNQTCSCILPPGLL